MQELFTSLAHAVEGAPAVALLAALAWGVLSVILSPCHLASIPLIVGFIGERGRVSTGYACRLSTLFAVGILLSIAIIGAVTAMAGRLMGDLGPYGNWFVALIFFGVGLHLLGVITIPLPGAHQPGMKKKGGWAAFVLGLVFGIALGPCTFAFMAPMLGVTFRLASTELPYALLLLLVYGIGHCLVIVIAGTSTEWVQRFLDWNENSTGLLMLKRACGLLIIVAGLFLIYTA